MKKNVATVVLILMFAASGCTPSLISLPPAPDGKKTYDQFVSSNSFPYAMEEERKNLILKSYEKLKLGMTKQEVSSLLGEPSFSQTNNTKEGKFIGSKWIYHFYKPEPNNVNLNRDRELSIFFNMEDQAVSISPIIIDTQPALRP